MNEKYVDVSYDEDNGIRLADAFRAVGRHLLACLLAGVVLGALALAYTVARIPSQYQSSFTVYVTNRSLDQQTSADASNADHLVGSDIDASNALANTYAFVFESGKMVAEAVKDAGLDGYEPWARQGALVFTKVEQKASLVTATVTAGSPQDAYDIATSLISIAPDYMSDIAKGSSMSVVEPPEVSTTPSSPSLPLNAAIGFLVGFVVAALVVVCKDGHGRFVGSREELEGRFWLPSVDDSAEVLPLLPQHALRTIGVTDVDGRGLAASNAIALATAFAKGGSRVLLIDCDAKGGACAKALGASREDGLTDVLAEHVRASDAVRGVAQGIDFLAPGDSAAGLGGRIQGERMAQLLKGLEKDYDHIVAVIPPALSDDAALVLAGLFGRVFLSVRSGRTSRADVAGTLRRLRLADVQVDGFIYAGPEPRGRARRAPAGRR